MERVRGTFQGRYFSGEGDVEYLQLLETARKVFDPDPELQSVPMLYEPAWNGFTEGPQWSAWWVQNSYGPTYCALPFFTEPLLTFLENSHALWFDQMGDGHTPLAYDRGAGKDPVTGEPRRQRIEWLAPDGCLCDAAKPGWVAMKQGDGRIDIHDWPLGFTAAGLLMQAELLLISRDADAIRHYLPKLERCANFIETRRDPEANLFLAGTATNLLAPSYAGWERPDGTYGKAYLAEISVTYIAALDRLIELEKLAGRARAARLYAQRRELARDGLAGITTDEGYFIRSQDPDGTRHGVYGAEKHGYFEATPNHDAIAFRVVDEDQARRIYAKIAAIPGLRPYDLIIPNYPSYDDMYAPAERHWTFGEWVNGGHWSTCEARTILAYYRLGKHEDIRRSVRRMLGYARAFRMENPLGGFGGRAGSPSVPVYLTYDAFGPFAAMVRGLFEYLYGADALTLVPHVPPGITRLEQHFPIRFGSKRLYLSVYGTGAIRAVKVNGEAWDAAEGDSIRLPYAQLPETARVQVFLGAAAADVAAPAIPAPVPGEAPGPGDPFWETSGIAATEAGKELPALGEKIRRFHASLVEAGLGENYEAAHAGLALECLATLRERRRGQDAGRIVPLPEEAREAAEAAYVQMAARVCSGLVAAIEAAAGSPDPARQQVHRLWRRRETGEAPSKGS